MSEKTVNSLQHIFAQFNGAWSFERSITSLLDTTSIARATGIALFTADTQSLLRYEENGQLMLTDTHAAPSSFFRHYLYVLRENAIHVLYGDGPQKDALYQELIYDTQNSILRSSATHVCGDDCYDSVYHLMDDNMFSLNTTVRGPRKDYVINTHFVRTQS